MCNYRYASYLSFNSKATNHPIKFRLQAAPLWVMLRLDP